MLNKNRIGILTLGVCLIIYGIVFLMHAFIPAWNYADAIRFWPIVLIMLGLEVLANAIFRKKEDDAVPLKLDGLSVILLVVVLVFAFALAATEFAAAKLPALLEDFKNTWDAAITKK
ncbi:MAG: DUF5668 domain-containing protein [Oscillospiraceae bacterium]|jgi:uncharacterized membrane protein HdeD (DUF308 family)|nr:DUF5668 domain-containing protein [Oscillospiraceae bacterium]